MSLAEYKVVLLGYNRTTPKVSANVDITTFNVSAAPAAIDWTTLGAVNPVKN